MSTAAAVALCLWSVVLTLNLADLGLCMILRTDKLSVFGILNPFFPFAVLLLSPHMLTADDSVWFAVIAGLLVIVNAVQLAYTLMDTRRLWERDK